MFHKGRIRFYVLVLPHVVNTIRAGVKVSISVAQIPRVDHVESEPNINIREMFARNALMFDHSSVSEVLWQPLPYMHTWLLSSY